MGITPAKDPVGLFSNTRCSALGIDKLKMWRLNVVGWGAAVEEGSSKAFFVRSRLLFTDWTQD